MKTQDIYVGLKHIEFFKDKVFLLQDDCIKLNFHEHLTILVYVDELSEECYVEYNRCTHCHVDTLDIVKELIYLSEGNLIFIEKKRRLSKHYYIVAIVTRGTFEKYKGTILCFKNVKVYSAAELLYQT
ncbi:MAG: hypothetical protein K0S71_1583 [Clostridia bacterium]|jgi:hypothetical protein|nr:hypothetical protein [Clostridia bacterium]